MILSVEWSEGEVSVFSVEVTSNGEKLVKVTIPQFHFSICQICQFCLD